MTPRKPGSGGSSTQLRSDHGIMGITLPSAGSGRESIRHIGDRPPLRQRVDALLAEEGHRSSVTSEEHRCCSRGRPTTTECEGRDRGHRIGKRVVVVDRTNDLERSTHASQPQEHADSGRTTRRADGGPEHWLPTSVSLCCRFSGCLVRDQRARDQEQLGLTAPTAVLPRRASRELVSALRTLIFIDQTPPPARRRWFPTVRKATDSRSWTYNLR